MSRLKELWAIQDERNLFINIFLAFLLKGASLLISLLSMPLYIRYFHDNEILGIWYTLLSMLSWITMCDLGLGNGLRNRLTVTLSQGDVVASKRYISSTYAVLSVIILPVLFVGSILLQDVDWGSFLNVSPDVLSNETLQHTIIILFWGVGISFVLKTINVIIYAIQKSSINNLLSLVTSILPLIYIALFKGETLAQNLLQLSIVHIISINFPLLIMTFILFRNPRLRRCAPDFKSCKVKTAKQMLSFGMQFFFSQIFFMFLMATNEIIITKIFSPESVVSYSIYYKLFTMVGSLFMLALTPLWSKITKDLSEKRYRTVQHTNRVLYKISILAILAEFSLVPFLQFAVNLWLGSNAITVHYPTAILFAVFGSLYILNVVLTTVANGMGELRTQMVFYGIGSVLKLPVIFLLKSLFNSWNVVVLFNCIILLLFCVFQFFWIEKKISRFIQMEES